MSKKIINIFVVIFTIQILTTACKADTFDMYREVINELNRDPKTRKMQGGEDDVDDLSRCPILIELGNWYWFEGKFSGWEKENVWKEGSINSYRGFVLHEEDNDLISNKILSNPKNHPVYIGPWHQITLTRTEGSFFSKKKITEEKQIRFFAYQKTEGGPIQYQYESMTDTNKSIPEKPFSLPPSGKIAPDKFSLCAVKWIAKYGYNAVYDQKTKKVIEVKE